MKIIVECECGNNAIMEMINSKAYVLRDNMEREGFIYEENKIESGTTKEMLLQCSVCKKWIIIDLK